MLKSWNWFQFSAQMSLNSEVLVAHYFCNISPESKILHLTNNIDLRFLNASRRWAGGFKGFLLFHSDWHADELKYSFYQQYTRTGGEIRLFYSVINNLDIPQPSNIPRKLLMPLRKIVWFIEKFWWKIAEW